MKGDLLLCTSNNHSVKFFGWFIALLTRSNYVHIAIVADNYGMIIEAVQPRVQQTKNYWISYDTYRVKNILEYQIDMALSYARKQIGDWYDFRALFYLAWLYITWQRNKINEWNFKNRWFCSELVCASFREADIVLCPELLDANVSPQDIANSKLVEKIN